MLSRMVRFLLMTIDMVNIIILLVLDIVLAMYGALWIKVISEL